jgi:peptidoglycan/LPS O-acetylase OafA/YrhL
MATAPASRLDALTSLRFVAAMMIVAFHAQTSFGNTPGDFGLAQGVSFFYVLSGFILTLVYPRLDGWAAVRRFWRARFARVWPAYFCALLVGWYLLAYAWDAGTVVAYVAMVQAWIPIPAFFFGYNAVGWSVSTEWFFYLVFPLLVRELERTWKWKLAVSFALVLAMAVLAHALDWPVVSHPWEPGQAFQPDQNGLMYTNPLARLFEFTCGMCVALAWRARRDAPARRGAAPAIEAGAVALCLVSLRLSTPATTWVQAHLGPALGLWFNASGSVLAFAVLVYVMAVGRGAISRALAWRPFVVLGEISFSIYLLHQVLLNAYLARERYLPLVPGHVAFALYLGLLWLSAYVMWRFVEMPLRRLIVDGALHGSSVVTQPLAVRLGARWRPALALVALGVAVVGLRIALDRGHARPRPASADGTPAQLTPNRAQGSCSIERVDGVSFTGSESLPVQAGTVQVTGWFLSEMSKVPGTSAMLRLAPESGTAGWTGPITHWVPRPDVLEVMHAQAAGNPGFAQPVDLSGLAPGNYRLSVAWSERGLDFACDPGRRITLGN